MAGSERQVPGPPRDRTAAKIDEKTPLTGSSDGLIRYTNTTEQADGGTGVARGLRGGYEEEPRRDTIASFAHDPIVRFNDISIFYEGDGNEKEEDEKDMDEEGGEGEDEEEEEGGSGRIRGPWTQPATTTRMTRRAGPAIPQLKTAAQSFFEDMYFLRRKG